MKIAIDIDGVLAEWNQPMWDLLAEKCAMRPFESVAGPTTWHWFKQYGATEDAIAHAKVRAGNFWMGTLPLHADANQGVRASLRELCLFNEVSFVTARSSARSITVNWLIQHFAIQPQVLMTPGRKAMALVAMEPDVIIEDSADNLNDFVAAERDYKLPPCLKILIRRPYNDRWTGTLSNMKGWLVVNSTAEALQAALTYKKETV